MRIGDIYKHKKYCSFVSIDGFLRKFNEDRLSETNPLLICLAPLQLIDDMVSYCPSDLLYGSQEDIEQEYELYKSSDHMNSIEYKELMEEIKEILLKDEEEFHKKFIE